MAKYSRDEGTQKYISSEGDIMGGGTAYKTSEGKWSLTDPNAKTNTTTTNTTSNQNAGLNSMSQTAAQANSRDFQVGTGDVAGMPQQQEMVSPARADRLAKSWSNLTYEQQQDRLSRTAGLKDALAKRGMTVKTQPTTQTTTTTPTKTTTTTKQTTPKQDQWDYQDNSQARMDQIADNLDKYRQTQPGLFEDASAFYNFFIDGKGRSQDQIDYLWNYFNRVQKFGKYDNLPASTIGDMLVNGDLGDDYLNHLKATDPAKYQEALSYKQKGEDDIKYESFLSDTADQAGLGSQFEKFYKGIFGYRDENDDKIDDSLYIAPTEEELTKQNRVNTIDSRIMEIKNMQKNLLDDLVEQYPGVPKATLMGIVQDRTKDLQREYDDLMVERTGLVGNIEYMQKERDAQSKARQSTINNLEKAYGMYYDYTAEGIAEMAQNKYAATNITLDQAENGTDTQKQMALESVLDGYYKKYGDIIQRSEQQVINDVIAYAKKNGIGLAQALQENFVKPLQQKPQFAAMESAYSEPNLQVMGYNSDGKAVYGYWDSATKTFKPVSVGAGGIGGVGTSGETSAEPLNDFIDTLLGEGLTIASNGGSGGSKIRSGGCGTVVNDYLGSIGDNIKLSEANDIKSYATSKTPAVGGIAYFNGTQSRATPETKKHGHVGIVTKDNGDTITVLESNTGTGLRYKDYKKSDVTGYYAPEGIKSADNTASYDNVFTKAGNAAFVGLGAMNRAAAEANLKSSLEDGDYSGAFEYITLNAKNSADSDTKSKISAAETAAIDLIAIRDALDAYLAAGGDTGLLKGSLEKVANKLGKTTDPQLAAIAVKISEAIQAYRKHITGAAFSKEEAKEYADLFPTISADEEYNAAKLDGTLNSMVTRLNQLYGGLLGPRTYINMLDAHEKATGRKYSVFEEQSDLYNYLKDNGYLNTDGSVKEAQDFATYMQSQNQRKGKRF